VLAGGTDLIPKMYHKQLKINHVINIKKIRKLNEISYDESRGLILGALVKFNELIYSETVQEHYPILSEVSNMVASHQIRNLATIGGNLCNAAPSADSAPILIALDSKVAIRGLNNKKRELPLEEFFVGPGESALKRGELLTQIQVPKIQPRTGVAYIKHTIRRGLEIAVVGVAGLIQLGGDSDKCFCARLVIGACAPTPLRIVKAEEKFTGNKLTEKNINQAAEIAAAEVKPISDVRARDEYRCEMVKVQCKHVLEEALARVPHN
jgi:carbon-monoxide dehydrogenase medium subunit